MKYTERCEGITSGGKQCKCYATQKINDIPYCEQHARKELSALAKTGSTAVGENRRAADSPRKP